MYCLGILKHNATYPATSNEEEQIYPVAVYAKKPYALAKDWEDKDTESNQTPTEPKLTSHKNASCANFLSHAHMCTWLKLINCDNVISRQSLNQQRPDTLRGFGFNMKASRVCAGFLAWLGFRVVFCAFSEVLLFSHSGLLVRHNAGSEAGRHLFSGFDKEHKWSHLHTFSKNAL